MKRLVIVLCLLLVGCHGFRYGRSDPSRFDLKTPPQKCYNCKGSGWYGQSPCFVCDGKGGR